VGKTLTQPATETFVKSKSFTGITEAVTSMIMWGTISGCSIYSTCRFWNGCGQCAQHKRAKEQALRDEVRGLRHEVTGLRDAAAV
jgi:hypothetical protein